MGQERSSVNTGCRPGPASRDSPEAELLPRAPWGSSNLHHRHACSQPDHLREDLPMKGAGTSTAASSQMNQKHDIPSLNTRHPPCLLQREER